MTSGAWEILGKNGLSHANLYGVRGDTPPQPIPLPAAAWMLLGGLAGLGVIGRRRRAAA